MHLYLVQHAEAIKEEEDPARPLTERGREDITRVARFAAEHCDIRAHAILHSGETRAAQTAEVLAQYLQPSGGIRQIEGLAPMDDVMTVAQMLEEQTYDLILVGHLPHLSKLAGRLLCGDENSQPVAFTMGGIVALERDETGKWSTRWILTPWILSR
jgi:phosphohistidine phosphatase